MGLVKMGQVFADKVVSRGREEVATNPFRKRTGSRVP